MLGVTRLYTVGRERRPHESQRGRRYPRLPRGPVTNAREPSTLRFRVGFFLVALLIVGIVIVLPFAIRSLIDDLYSSVEGDVYPFDGTATSQDASARNR